MNSYKKWLLLIILAGTTLGMAAEKMMGAEPDGGKALSSLDPRGAIHIPIGIADTVDTLKTFVEAEGNFSPGCGSYGVYFWVYDPVAGKLTAPTMPDVACRRGLPPEGFLIPWASWDVGDMTVTTRVCEVQRRSPAGDVFAVGATAELNNTGSVERKMSLYVALRPLGPAGFPVKAISVSDSGDSLLVEGHPAIVADAKPDAAGVLATGTIGSFAMEGRMPVEKAALSDKGDCSGALRYELTIPAGKTVKFGFICPVLPGRRAARHEWDGENKFAQLDLAAPNPTTGGLLQPDPGLEYYRGLKADKLFAEAKNYWKGLAARPKVRLPDTRWQQALAAILGHAVLEMNEGAPDVAVINYNVFNRDGVYVANILQKSGRFELAEKAIEYFLSHPFNGRVQVEADNPGQILWAMGQQWQLSRDRRWLEGAYPGAAKIAAMIRYYRTTPPPHYVKATSLEFGDALPPDAPSDKSAQKRQILQPGACDGFNPNYTEAFDVAGTRAAAIMARALGKTEEAQAWEQLAASLMEKYDQRFGTNLPAGYGSYSVLWPCRLYSLQEGKGFEQFEGFGVQNLSEWRYFALATAHQGLLCGNREAGYGTLEKHLAHEQMKGWYAFDEGGGSGQGGWKYYRTKWNPSVAMPHGWAIAELWLLLRDCLAFEDGERLVLLGGVPPDWFQQNMAIEHFPTQFGDCSVQYVPATGGVTLRFSGSARPPGGFVLRLPASLAASLSADGKPARQSGRGDWVIPAETQRVSLKFAPAARTASSAMPFTNGLPTLNISGQTISGPAKGSDSGAWLEAMRRWREQELARMHYNGREYDRPELAWTRRSFIQAQMMVEDRYFYDPVKGCYTVDRYLDDLEARYGGLDSVLIWPVYPNIGIDNRNQHDMLRAMPGGLAGVKQMVADFHRRGVRVLFPEMPWDAGGRVEGVPLWEAVARDMKAVGADGINGDAQPGVRREFLTASMAVGHPLAFEPENNMGDIAMLQWNHMDWGYWPYPAIPEVSKYKWLESRHLTHVCERWARDRSAGLQAAFFNGVGYVAWENIWGVWNQVTPRDAAAIRRIRLIEHATADLLCSPDWEPHVRVLQDEIFASRFPGSGRSVWLLVNSGTADKDGRQLRVLYREGTRYYDLWNAVRLKPEVDGNTAALAFKLEGRSYGAVLAVDPGQPNADIEAVLPRLATLAKTPLKSLSAEWHVLPQRIVEIHPTAPARTAPPGMVQIPAGKFCFQVSGVEIEGWGCPANPKQPGTDVQCPWEDLPRMVHDRELDMKSFYIDRFPVTNDQFKKFLDATGYQPRDAYNFLKDWKNGTYPDGWANKPVTWVSIEDAREYARWAGKRLPHEWEWQYAAQGTDGRPFPWGDQDNPEARPQPDEGHDLRGPTDVDAFPKGASPFGVMDMIGNVWQWTDEYVDEHTRAAVVRGGGYYRPAGAAWYFPRNTKLSQHGKYLLMAPCKDRSGCVGFRCVVDT